MVWRFHALTLDNTALTRGFASALRTPVVRTFTNARGTDETRSESGDPVCVRYGFRCSGFRFNHACSIKPARPTSGSSAPGVQGHTAPSFGADSVVAS